MRIIVDGHAFTLTDARRTLASAADLFGHAMGRGDHDVIAPIADRAIAIAGEIDPQHAPADALRKPLTAFWREWLEVGPALRAAGRFAPTSIGSAVALHRSDGGVPKTPVDQATIDLGGVVGDRQAARVHHGRPWQALCLWSGEVIAALAEEGHPIHPGATGENVTVAGIDWAHVRPGVRLAIGDVRCEVLAYAIPCSKNARWFRDGDHRRIHHDQGDRSRVYARVLRPGVVTAGDTVVFEPSPA